MVCGKLSSSAIRTGVMVGVSSIATTAPGSVMEVHEAASVTAHGAGGDCVSESEPSLRSCSCSACWGEAQCRVAPNPVNAGNSARRPIKAANRHERVVHIYNQNTPARYRLV